MRLLFLWRWSQFCCSVLFQSVVFPSEWDLLLPPLSSDFRYNKPNRTCLKVSVGQTSSLYDPVNHIKLSVFITVSAVVCGCRLEVFMFRVKLMKHLILCSFSGSVFIKWPTEEHLLKFLLSSSIWCFFLLHYVYLTSLVTSHCQIYKVECTASDEHSGFQG